MTFPVSRREFISFGAQTVAVAAASKLFVVEALGEEAKSSYASVFSTLDTFVERYMREMNAPGMTLVIADRDGVQRVATYGWSDKEQKAAVKPDQLFHIGSISKSFVANCLLQLNQEGKLDLHKPIVEYLPWFHIESSFEPITTHHLLTHSAGLPGNAPLFLADPSEKHRAAYAPGAHFHYCNLGYVAMGHLLSILDGRSLPEAIRARALEPLGMTQSEPVISLDIREKTAKNYGVFQNDRPYPRDGKLSEAAAIIMTDGSGCVAATPRDMGLYIQMIANHGKGPKGALLSEKSFGLFSERHIKADEFGPTASYGYGIAVDTLDGHKILRHTGGMVSFASSIQVDIDAGVGAFASINAMQGYRPNPVAQYAIQLMRAYRESKSHFSAPVPNPANLVKNAADYAGAYEGVGGRKLQFVADGDALFLMHEGKRVGMQSASGDSFLVLHPEFERFLLVFERSDEKDPKTEVIAAGWGNDWFTNSKYKGPKTFDSPKEWGGYVGHYRNENPWIGSMHIVLRRGKMMVDGVVPLEERDGVFHLQDEPESPEWIRFLDVVNGRAMHLKFSGEDLWRVIAE
jgi:CubicO group peptidase (beta-lactamase class C family)